MYLNNNLSQIERRNLHSIAFLWRYIPDGLRIWAMMAHILSHPVLVGNKLVRVRCVCRLDVNSKKAQKFVYFKPSAGYLSRFRDET